MMDKVFLDDVSWGSHLPALLACVAATEGPVLELGVGHYSTTLLHAVCCPRRRLVSVEDGAEFLRMFKEFNRDGHELILSPEYECLGDLAQQSWSVVLVDHSPGTRRARDTMLFRDSAEYIVLHDYNDEGLRSDLRPSLSQFPFTRVTGRYTPPTLVLSQKEIPHIP